MALKWENLGFNFSGWYSSVANPPISYSAGGESVVISYLELIKSKEITYLRDGGTDPIFSTATGSGRTVATYVHSLGFDNIWGCCRSGQGNTTTPANWATHATRVIAQAALCANGTICNTFSVGNEEEERIATQSVATLSRTSNVVTATFSSDHGYQAGQTVIIAGASPSDYNNASGATILSTPDSTSFTYSAAGADGTATGTITAKMTNATFRGLVKQLAADCRAVASNLKYIYTSTETHVGAWAAETITPGVDLDYYGLNSYSSSPTDTAGFRTAVQTGYTGQGDKLWVTEWNVYFNWGTSVGTLNTTKKMERYVEERLNVLREIGVSRAFYFNLNGRDYGVFDYVDLLPRNGYYSLFNERRTAEIHYPTTSSAIASPSTPTVALRNSSDVDRDKCIDFNQTNSYLTGTYPSFFTASNLTKFTIAVRLYPRSYGGSAAGRIMSNINQKFVEIITQSGGYNCQIWHSGTSASTITGSGSIVFSTWQTLVMTFNDAWNYPKVYIDCIEKTNSPVTKSGSRGSCNGQTISIGNRSDLIRGYDGLMDDFFVYNRVLTRKEMGLYKNGHIPSGYIFGYTMNEASGDVIDSGDYAANLTPSNVAQDVTGYTT